MPSIVELTSCPSYEPRKYSLALRALLWRPFCVIRVPFESVAPLRVECFMLAFRLEILASPLIFVGSKYCLFVEQALKTSAKIAKKIKF